MPPPLPRQSKVSISREEEHRIRDRTVRFEPLCILVSPEAQGLDPRGFRPNQWVMFEASHAMGSNRGSQRVLDQGRG